MRDAWRRAAVAQTEADRQNFVNKGRALLRALISKRDRGRVLHVVKQGKLATRTSGLQTVRAVRADDGQLLDSEESYMPLLSGFFRAKWGCGQLCRIEAVTGLACDLEAAEPGISPECLAEASEVHRPTHPPRRPRRRSRLAGRALPEAAPGRFARALNSLAASTSEMSAFEVFGRRLGKGTARPRPQEVRCILSLPPLLQILDVVLSRTFHAWLSATLPLPLGTHSAGTPGTETLEVAHGLSLYIKQAFDSRSRGAVAQTDVDKYYDSIDVHRTAR